MMRITLLATTVSALALAACESTAPTSPPGEPSFTRGGEQGSGAKIELREGFGGFGLWDNQGNECWAYLQLGDNNDFVRTNPNGIVDWHRVDQEAIIEVVTPSGTYWGTGVANMFLRVAPRWGDPLQFTAVGTVTNLEGTETYRAICRAQDDARGVERVTIIMLK